MPFNRVKALEATLGAAVKILEIADDVLGTAPIPGAAAVIKVILDVVKRQERAGKNAERTNEERKRWEDVVNQMAKYKTNPPDTLPDAPSELQVASQELVSQLEDYARELKRVTTHIRPRWMTCDSDEEALQDFVDKSSKAVADYHHTQGNRIEQYIVEIGREIKAIANMVQKESEESKIKEFDRLMEKLRAPLAGYNANRRVGTLSSCSEGTRIPLLQTVSDWINDPHSDRIFWLKERAGFGKTAIALSVAEHTANEGTLAASFFFSYQIGDLSDTSRFLPTIIHQLCLFGGASFKQSFAAAIAEHTTLFDAKLKDQVQKLLLQPLGSPDLAPPTKPIVIVIDALDECQHEDTQDLITTFIASLSSLNLPLKVFITSRPEPHLTAAFEELGVESRGIVDTSDEDVETYLRAELAKIPSKPGIKNLRLPRDWITEVDIQALLERSGAKGADSGSGRTEKGLFVYIATVVRFVGDTRSCDPQKHLEIVLSADPPQQDYRPFQVLDNLYGRVLDVALDGRDDLLRRFRAVAGGLVAVETGDDLSISHLEDLLGLRPGEVRRTLLNLQSVIQCPDTDHSALPSFHHRSFTDFLTTQDRSGPRYFIDHKLHKKQLALGCMQLIAASPLKGEVTNAMNKEDFSWYPGTQHSTVFWHATFRFPTYLWDIHCHTDILEEVEKFIRDDFGWWIELLSALGHPRYTNNYHLISDAVDPRDERELPMLFRGLYSWGIVFAIDRGTHAPALFRKELRRYITAVTKQQGDQSQVEAQALTMSIKKYIHEPREGLRNINSWNDDKMMKPCAAILTLAKDMETAVDKYQLSVGNTEEVDISRRRTTFLRRQVKPLLVKKGWITEDEPFEETGIFAVKETENSGSDLSTDEEDEEDEEDEGIGLE